MSAPTPAQIECGKKWHYWFDFWTRKGWSATCKRCGYTAHGLRS